MSLSTIQNPIGEVNAVSTMTGPSEEIPPPPPFDCTEEEHRLLLGDVVLTNVRWRNPRNGETGCGTAIPHLAKTGHFWFFNDQNIELTCKALNGVEVNGFYWVFCGGLTDVEWWMTAINNPNPATQEEYYNPPRTMASFGDTQAFGEGPNHAPRFRADGELPYKCDAVYETPYRPNILGAWGVFVEDIDGDEMTGRVVLLQGEGVEVTQGWENPIPAAGREIQLGMRLPNRPGEYSMGIEVTDGNSYLPTLCAFTAITY